MFRRLRGNVSEIGQSIGKRVRGKPDSADAGPLFPVPPQVLPSARYESYLRILETLEHLDVVAGPQSDGGSSPIVSTRVMCIVSNIFVSSGRSSASSGMPM